LKKVIFFNLLLILILIVFWALGPLGKYSEWTNEYLLSIQCILTACLAGCLYGIRAIYINYCVHDNWVKRWEVWYYLRPFASAISGFAAYIFLKAGLVVLEANQDLNSGDYGFLVFAFIAGLNVDNFVKKIEEIAKSTFGIEQSRVSRGED